MSGKPTVISTFAGCGGSSLGYQMAGYKELLAIEWDKTAVETFQLNFPDIPIWQRDIRTVTSEEILLFCGLKVGELDLLDGSPPCQGFSTAGKRRVYDARNDLFREFVRLIQGLQPKVFVMENVSGMVKGTMKGMFREIILALKDCGYQVKCRLMNTMYYGVPQSRQRLIFIGVRNDLMIEPNFPGPQTKPITVREAFAGLSENLDAPEMSGNYIDYWLKTKPGGYVGKRFDTEKLNYNQVSGTLQSSEGYGGKYHPQESRPINTLERKRLSSFPDNFIFLSWKTAIILLGNSVPPLFMNKIARHIKDNILETAKQGV